MPDLATLTLFVAAASVLLLVPGPAVLFIVARSVEQGRVAGLVSALGIAVGTVVHILAAALGLSALLLSSAIAFDVVKYAGAAYLIYLGVRKFLEPASDLTPAHVQPQPLSRIFTQAIIVNLLNPKTALFFLAFLPQFVHPERGPVAVQVFVLGAILMVLGMLSDGAYALLAGSVMQWIRRRDSGVLRSQRYWTGSVYIGLGVTAALTRRH